MKITLKKYNFDNFISHMPKKMTNILSYKTSAKQLKSDCCVHTLSMQSILWHFVLLCTVLFNISDQKGDLLQRLKIV